jgi:hypothetical protein
MLYLYSTDDRQWKISCFRRGVGQVRSSRFVCCLATQKSEELVNTVAQWSCMSKNVVGYVRCRKGRHSAPNGRHCVQLRYSSALVDVSGHHHAPIELLSPRLYSPSPRKEQLIPIEKENEWAPEPVWALKKRKNLVPLRGMVRRVIQALVLSLHSTAKPRIWTVCRINCGGCTLHRKVETHIPASVCKYGRKRPSVEVDYGFHPIESFSNVNVKFLS